MFKKLRAMLRAVGDRNAEQDDDERRRRSMESHQQATTLRKQGRHDEALRLYNESLTLTRELAQRHPEEHVYQQGAVRILLDMADSLTALGRQSEAVDVLKKGEAIIQELGAIGISSPEEMVAELYLTRGFAHYEQGFGASAVIDFDAASKAYRRFYDAAKTPPRALDLARVLTLNAAALAEAGDPDLALNAAEHAIHLYNTHSRSNEFRANAMMHEYFLKNAATVAANIHAAHGRIERAVVADIFAVNILRSWVMLNNNPHDRQELAQALTRRGLHQQAQNTASEEATALLNEGRAIDASAAQREVEQWKLMQAGQSPLQVTVATALEAAARELGATQVPESLIKQLTRPEIGAAALSPGDRCRPEQAVELAVHLVELSSGLLFTLRREGLRLGLEAHYLFANASRMQTSAIRNQLHINGPSWARVILTCSRAFEAEENLRMAYDLADWGAHLATLLLPSSGTEVTLRPLIRELVERYDHLCSTIGIPATGNAFLQKAEALWKSKG